MFLAHTVLCSAPPFIFGSFSFAVGVGEQGGALNPQLELFFNGAS